MNRAIDPRNSCAYRLADVAWVSPLRDGMNLVAKEYAACKPEGDGVLVLSEFAGAAAEMGEALLVNPYDEESTAMAVARALELDEDERRKRMLALHRRVLRNNVFAWSETFLSHLAEAVLARAARVGESSPRPLPVSEAVDAYRAAGRRMLLLDYDGTLVGFASVPELATPAESLLRDLRALAAEPSNLVALVSGRASHDLARWFGDVRGLWLFAEHGVEVRNPEQMQEPRRPIQTDDWKRKVLDPRTLCRSYARELCRRKKLLGRLALSHGRAGVWRMAGQRTGRDARGHAGRDGITGRARRQNRGGETELGEQRAGHRLPLVRRAFRGFSTCGR